MNFDPFNNDNLQAGQQQQDNGRQPQADNNQDRTQYVTIGELRAEIGERANNPPPPRNNIARMPDEAVVLRPGRIHGFREEGLTQHKEAIFNTYETHLRSYGRYDAPAGSMTEETVRTVLVTAERNYARDPVGTLSHMLANMGAIAG